MTAYSAGRGVSPPPRPDTLGPIGRAGAIAFYTDLVVRVEETVAALHGTELPLHLTERYERALAHGHADNLRRVRIHQEA